MSQAKHPLDHKIIALLQQRGMIKSEAKTRLKNQVYKLQASEVNQINNYSNHFGLNAKQKLIDEILDIRREAMISSLTSEKGRI
jgi:ABC-type phosphate transport system auxiliary subunit